MQKRALAFRIDDASKVEVVFGSSKGDFDRGYFFAFMNSLNCELVEITTTTTLTTTTGLATPLPAWLLPATVAAVCLALIILLCSMRRKATPEEYKHYLKGKFDQDVQQANDLLNAKDVNYSDPELRAVLKKLTDNKQHVKALCGTLWLEWSAPGKCQVCNVNVDRKEKGLHCQAGGHRICWTCMCKNMDWDKVGEAELANKKGDIDLYVWRCSKNV